MRMLPHSRHRMQPNMQLLYNRASDARHCPAKLVASLGTALHSAARSEPLLPGSSTEAVTVTQFCSDSLRDSRRRSLLSSGTSFRSCITSFESWARICTMHVDPSGSSLLL